MHVIVARVANETLTRDNSIQNLFLVLMARTWQLFEILMEY